MLKLNQPATDRFVHALVDDQPAHHQMDELEHRMMRIAAEITVGKYTGDGNFELQQVKPVAKTAHQNQDIIEVVLVETTIKAEYAYTLQLSVNEWRTVLVTVINS